MNVAARLHQHVEQRLHAYAGLMRLDRPIGILLLLWPTLWALWLAGEGRPDSQVVLVFLCGVFLMRSAGCVINDFADRHFDGHVERTRSRPLPAGKVRAWEAVVLFLALSLCAFVLVLTLDPLTIKLSVVALLLAASYPFMKRFTHFPQTVLGAAFGWAIPMAWAAQTGTIPAEAWLLFAANLLWTVAYDTWYAMVDRDDDLSIGIKSTAVLFGRHAASVIALLQVLTLGLLYVIGHSLGLGWQFELALVVVAGLFIYQHWLGQRLQRAGYFQAFLNNNPVGLIIFAGIAGHYLFGL